jgi:uncharacterized SAM-binding protein YcdF (DUF218 family)
MTGFLFFLKKLISAVVLSPSVLLFAAVLGLLCLRRWPRVGRTLAWLGIGSLLVCSLPITAQLVAYSVMLDPALAARDRSQAQAVVILGGGSRRAPEYGGWTLSHAALERVRYGAKVAREQQLPILVTGGVVSEGEPEGELMAAALRDSFGAEPRWIEAQARDTKGNAILSAAILKAAGVHTIVLVTHDLHERRSRAEFTALGLDVIPAGVTTIGPLRFNGWSFMPSAAALELTFSALHEILGILVLSPAQSRVNDPTRVRQ